MPEKRKLTCNIHPPKVPPKWKLEPKDREASLGDQISIDCQATG